MDYEQYKNYAVLAVQSALVDAVTFQLRAAIVDVYEYELHLFFFYDGYIDEKLQDLLECASTEASTAFPPDFSLRSTIDRLDYPMPIPILGKLAYLRHEKMCRSAALLAMSQALIGKISPNLRAAKINWNDSVIDLLFYYHGEIAELEKDLANSVAVEFTERFPSYQINLEMIRSDYPHAISPVGEWAYLKQEVVDA